MYDTANNQISLTNAHLIYVKSIGYTKVSDVKLGDILRINSSPQTEFVDFLVSRITYDLKEGFIAPLTAEGTLLVNRIDTSCYAEVNDHHMADLIMTPVKLWYKLNKYMNGNKIRNRDPIVNPSFYSTAFYNLALHLFPSYLN